MKVYLAGPMETKWREPFIKKLKEMGHEAICPEDGKKDPNAIVKDDLEMIRKCDLIIAVLEEDAHRIGTSMEIMAGYTYGVPVVSAYHKSHPWLLSLSNLFFESKQHILDSMNEVIELVSTEECRKPMEEFG